MDDLTLLGALGGTLQAPWLQRDRAQLARHGRYGGVRNDPSGIEHLGMGDVVDHYAKIIGELDQKPIIMGHSLAP